MPLTEPDRQAAVRLAALAERLLPPEACTVQTATLRLVRLTVAQHALDAVQVWDTATGRCVLCVTRGEDLSGKDLSVKEDNNPLKLNHLPLNTGGGQVLLWKPGGWQEELVLAAATPVHATHDTIQLTLDVAATLLAEAAVHEHAVQVAEETLSPLEEVGCCVLRAWERQRVGSILAADLVYTGNREQPGRLGYHANGTGER